MPQDGLLAVTLVLRDHLPHCLVTLGLQGIHETTEGEGKEGCNTLLTSRNEPCLYRREKFYTRIYTSPLTANFSRHLRRTLWISRVVSRQLKSDRTAESDSRMSNNLYTRNTLRASCLCSQPVVSLLRRWRRRLPSTTAPSPSYSYSTVESFIATNARRLDEFPFETVFFSSFFLGLIGNVYNARIFLNATM